MYHYPFINTKVPILLPFPDVLDIEKRIWSINWFLVFPSFSLGFCSFGRIVGDLAENNAEQNPQTKHLFSFFYLKVLGDFL